MGTKNVFFGDSAIGCRVANGEPGTTGRGEAGNAVKVVVVMTGIGFANGDGSCDFPVVARIAGA